VLSFPRRMSGQKDERSMMAMPLPIVYENVPVTPPVWEYEVLTIDTREDALPDAALLNEKGRQGWLLVSVVEQRVSQARVPYSQQLENQLLTSRPEQKAGEGTRFVHYYFVRQKAQ
jgi:hypothetical protein